jgi:hypothetical protein
MKDQKDQQPALVHELNIKALSNGSLEVKFPQDLLVSILLLGKTLEGLYQQVMQIIATMQEQQEPSRIIKPDFLLKKRGN